MESSLLVFSTVNNLSADRGNDDNNEEYEARQHTRKE